MSNLLALVPGCAATGGIQVSARIAWEGIQVTPPFNQSPFLFCYGQHGSDGPASVHTSSRSGAVLAALRLRGKFQVVVVWHTDLLRLLPFLRLRDANVVLILQGIEAWRRRAVLERLLLRRVDLFLSISDYTWQRFVDVYPEFARAEHRTVPLGIDHPLPESAPPPGKVPVALMISRLSRGEDYKGHRQMIDAWHRVLARIPNAELWIAGDGDLRPDLEACAIEQGLGDSVRFLGFVSEQTKHQLLCQSRCLAVPSRGEGFGLVYLEALRLARPCLVSCLDAGREVVDPPRHGLAVDPDDPESIATAAIRMLTDGPEWEEWSRRARERYEQHFTATHYQKRFLSALAVRCQ